MIDSVIETRRQLYIERLYERAGRSCGTYSGLLQEHIQKLLQEDMDRVLAEGGTDAAE
jgi:shikimate kinase